MCFAAFGFQSEINLRTLEYVLIVLVLVALVVRVVVRVVGSSNTIVVAYNINTYILYHYSTTASTTITTTPATNQCKSHLC